MEIMLKKRIIIFSLSFILVLAFFAYKKIAKYFDSSDGEEVFEIIKSKHSFLDNWLMYMGIALILVSILGIICLFYNPKNKKKKLKKEQISVERKYVK